MSFKARTSTAPKRRRLGINTNKTSTRPRDDSSAGDPHANTPEISPDVNGLLDSMDNVEVIAATPNLDPRLAQPRIAQQSGQLSGDATPRVVQPLQHAQSGLPSGGATPHVVQFPQRTDARQERDNATYPENAKVATRTSLMTVEIQQRMTHYLWTDFKY